MTWFRFILSETATAFWPRTTGRRRWTPRGANSPDLIVLDLLLPELDGTDVCRLLRAESHVPIIMLTARSTDEDKLLGLDIGADDYLTKPFNPRELVARVRAVLRRATPDEEPAEDVRFGDLTVSFIRHEVFLQSRPVSLTPTEFRLLETLVKNPGRAFSRADLLDRAFGYDYDGVERTVDVHIMNLRRKIEPEPGRPRYVATVPGCGLSVRGSSCGVACASGCCWPPSWW